MYMCACGYFLFYLFHFSLSTICLLRLTSHWRREKNEKREKRKKKREEREKKEKKEKREEREEKEEREERKERRERKEKREKRRISYLLISLDLDIIFDILIIAAYSSDGDERVMATSEKSDCND
jgi:Flp pilus assembly protein TadB